MTDTPKIPKKYKHQEVEERWGESWEESGVYHWDPERPRDETFVVDTPPPTVSGSLHVGHVYSYSQTDAVVRFQRMMGKNIFYPMGWDDNGLPTERRVQNYYGVRCDPNIAYDPNLELKHAKGKDNKVPISRQNFIEACDILTKEDEIIFKKLWSHLGLSVDWRQEYATIDKDSIKISQHSFVDLIDKGLAYNTYSPTMWDVDFQSAIAQAEIEDREIGGAYHDIRFGIEGGGEFTISTTRPELLPACIAVVAHPDDQRYQDLFGKTAITPLFHAPVPIMAADHADPEKGTGILMVCTFGDVMDVEWWKGSDVPMKQLVGKSGRLLNVTHGEGAFLSNNVEKANKNYAELAELYPKQARRKIAELLAEEGSFVDDSTAALTGEIEQIMHPVKFFEKGDRPLEFVPTRQWFINVMDHKDALVKQGKKVQWHPEFMYSRYENWVEGLNQDWCISRQRFFGVPFPVWYPVKDDGEADYDSPIYATKDLLPVDPLTDTAPGFEESQRGKPGGFIGDPDVMDTWATSSMTPQIASKWSIDDERHKKLFPMDIRPQGHDIIRTWAFSTITKSWMHEDEIPWKHALISGWILDPDRKKMSKSKGNVVTPESMLQNHSADAVRYWALRARLGVDTAFDEKLFKIGQKLTTKVFNASRFVLMQMDRVGASVKDFSPEQISEPLDLAMVAKLRGVIENSKRSFNNFDYATALSNSEDAFWEFCDNYLELVKVRSYSDEDTPGRTSAFAALSWALKTYLRLFAPFLPYVTEEVWSWSFSSGKDAIGSVHVANWPSVEEVTNVAMPEYSEAYPAAIEVISKIRAAKTSAQKSLKWEVSKLSIGGQQEHQDALNRVLDDVLKGGNVNPEGVNFSTSEAAEDGMFSVSVELAETNE